VELFETARSCYEGSDSEAARVAMEINVRGKRVRGKLKKRWMNRIMNDIKIAGVGKGEV